jgi:hypothetical protein
MRLSAQTKLKSKIREIWDLQQIHTLSLQTQYYGPKFEIENRFFISRFYRIFLPLLVIHLVSLQNANIINCCLIYAMYCRMKLW